MPTLLSIATLRVQFPTPLPPIDISIPAVLDADHFGLPMTRALEDDIKTTKSKGRCQGMIRHACLSLPLAFRHDADFPEQSDVSSIESAASRS